MKNFVSLLALTIFAALFAATNANAQSADKMMTHKDGAHTMKADHSKDAMMAKAEYTLIELSQTEGQYEQQTLTLKPGKYVFAVTNDGVDKDLGFYLQDATEAQVENSGLKALIGNGETNQTGVVTLTPGTYQYSCPLNPTPHYTITVK